MPGIGESDHHAPRIHSLLAKTDLRASLMQGGENIVGGQMASDAFWVFQIGQLRTLHDYPVFRPECLRQCQVLARRFFCRNGSLSLQGRLIWPGD